MRKLDRYIGSHVLLAILSVLGVIVGLALLFAFIDELGDVKYPARKQCLQTVVLCVRMWLTISVPPRPTWWILPWLYLPRAHRLLELWNHVFV